MTRAAALLVLCAGLAACGVRAGLGADGQDGQPGESGSPGADGWTDLLASLDGWHGYARADAPAAWSLSDGVLTFTPGTEDGGDLVAPGTWGDFELVVEWRVSECGNSGLFYRGEEAADLAPVWRTALEAQLLDDACNPDGAYPSHRAGALYDLYAPAPVPPADGWRSLRVVASGDRIEHWLDGQRVVQARQGSADWDARLAVSKFRDGDAFPSYGKRRSGIVGLQDHGDRLDVRAFRIRPL